VELFGFLSAEHAPPEAGKAWRIARVERTLWGGVKLWELAEPVVAELSELRRDEEQRARSFGEPQLRYQASFSSRSNNLQIAEPEFREGNFKGGILQGTEALLEAWLLAGSDRGGSFASLGLPTPTSFGVRCGCFPSTLHPARESCCWRRGAGLRGFWRCWLRVGGGAGLRIRQRP
jgi:hypothetical protein